MLLVDTSVWSVHLRRHDAALAQHLQAGNVLAHPFVIGELACGVFPRRAEVLAALRTLPSAPLLGQAELLEFIERHDLAGRGVGFVDIHLLGAALVSSAALWTQDKALAAAAEVLGCLHQPRQHWRDGQKNNATAKYQSVLKKQKIAPRASVVAICIWGGQPKSLGRDGARPVSYSSQPSPIANPWNPNTCLPVHRRGASQGWVGLADDSEYAEELDYSVQTPDQIRTVACMLCDRSRTDLYFQRHELAKMPIFANERNNW